MHLGAPALTHVPSTLGRMWEGTVDVLRSIAFLFFPRVRRSTLTIRVALRFDSASASLISCFRCSALSMIITSTALPFVRILTAPSFSPFCFAPPPAPPLVHVVPPPALLIPRPPRL